MALTSNPTRTRTIEKAWLRDSNRRWREFERQVKSELERFDQPIVTNVSEIDAGQLPCPVDSVGGHPSETIVTNAFQMDSGQLAQFMDLVNDYLDETILEVIQREGLQILQRDDWQARYIDEAYFRSLERAASELVAQVPAGQPLPASLAQLGAIDTAAGSQIAAALAQDAIHLESRSFLHNRAFESLKDVTQESARRIRQVLLTAIDEGKGIRVIERELADQIGISRRRAQLIARTETIQAYQRSHINQAEVIQGQLDEPILLRWVSVRDTRVRDLHRRYHGRLFTPQEARAAIGRSPWNCRCGLLEVIEEANTPEKDEKFTREREELEAMAEPEG